MSKDSLNILFLTQGEKISGPESWRIALSKYFTNKGYQVTQVNSAPIRSVFELLKLKNIDIIHAYHARGSTVFFLIFAKLFNKKTIYTVHGHLVYEKVTKQGIKRLIWLPIHRVCFFFSDSITFPSKYLLDEMVKYFPAINRKSSVIRNGLNVQIYKKHSRLESKQHFNLLAITGFTYLKKVQGLDPLINAVSALKKKYPEINLDILGDGKHLQEYKEKFKTETNVKFLGHRDPKEFLSKTDLFVHSSLLDNSPMVILEAISANIPTISVKVGGIPELLPAEALASPTKESLGLKIEHALKSENFRNKILKSSQKKILEFDIKKTGVAMTKIYKGLQN
jgi:glycosyltransferase involved in cell wall biosynthesis